MPWNSSAWLFIMVGCYCNIIWSLSKRCVFVGRCLLHLFELSTSLVASPFPKFFWPEIARMQRVRMLDVGPTRLLLTQVLQELLVPVFLISSIAVCTQGHLWNALFNRTCTIVLFLVRPLGLIYHCHMILLVLHQFHGLLLIYRLY